MKVCRKCGRELDDNKWDWRATRRKEPKYICIECEREESREYYAIKKGLSYIKQLFNYKKDDSFLYSFVIQKKYPSWFNQSVKNRVRTRFGNKCFICDKHRKNLFNELEVHHIDYNKLSEDINNLVPLCSKCHTKTNNNRGYWYHFIKDKLEGFKLLKDVEIVLQVKKFDMTIERLKWVYSDIYPFCIPDNKDITNMIRWLEHTNNLLGMGYEKLSFNLPVK